MSIIWAKYTIHEQCTPYIHRYSRFPDKNKDEDSLQPILSFVVSTLRHLWSIEPWISLNWEKELCRLSLIFQTTYRLVKFVIVVLHLHYDNRVWLSKHVQCYFDRQRKGSHELQSLARMPLLMMLVCWLSSHQVQLKITHSMTMTYVKWVYHEVDDIAQSIQATIFLFLFSILLGPLLSY